jgi:hypothetical protein
MVLSEVGSLDSIRSDVIERPIWGVSPHRREPCTASASYCCMSNSCTSKRPVCRALQTLAGSAAKVRNPPLVANGCAHHECHGRCVSRCGGMSKRAAAVHFGVSRASVKKSMGFWCRQARRPFRGGLLCDAWTVSGACQAGPCSGRSGCGDPDIRLWPCGFVA